MSASKRCMICELHTGTFLANSRAFVRIMGVILAIEAATDDQTYPMAKNHLEEDLCLLVLDDGTASVDLWTPRSMIHSLAAEPGQTLDCMARLRQNGLVKRWYSDTLIPVTDTETESLRWMEVSHPPNPNECRRFGFPTKKLNANEAYRLICVQTQFEKNGVSLEDLALVMQKSKSTMQEMIQELQITGQIYQNEKGNYVPL
jgi:hypothetical protein